MYAPLRMTPYYRHGDETPWGGTGLADLLGRTIPDDRTGESLEVSALPGRESVCASGALRGAKLSEILGLWGENLTGAPGDFPLLLKLISARESLSVQVHPDDAYARRVEDKYGKTEAWLILSCDVNARLVYGLDGDIARGIEESLRWVRVRPGDALYIPAGCVHAIGAGITLYEIQQPSDVTYRLWDWGRGRELHLGKARDVIRPEMRPEPLPGATLLCEGGSRTYFVADDHFELSRLNVSGTMPLSAGRMRLVTALAPCEIASGDARETLAPGDTCLIPAACAASVTGQGSVLCAATPAQDALRAALGYRAGLVAGLTE